MSIEFKPKKENILVEENLVVDGEVVGIVATKIEDGPYKYHAAINFKSGWFNLIQGHGPTKEAAVMAAIEKARKDANILLSNIDEFETRISKE